MKKHILPSVEEWQTLSARPEFSNNALQSTVLDIFNQVIQQGDEALVALTKQFDGVELSSLYTSTKDVADIDLSLQNAISLAQKNIENFHTAQKQEKQEIETTQGVCCWRESRAIERIGIYIPGGSAPLFSSLLMLAIPARIAGCNEIVVCTPPDKNGNVNPVILYTAKLLGIEKVYNIGGIQAIAAMTFGTGTIPSVYKIFGPGNQYVNAAKQAAQNFGVAIDMPAGPSEVLVIANKTSVPEFVAADLLSQAEHGADSQVILLTDSEVVLHQVQAAIETQLATLPRRETAAQALQNSRAILLNNISDCIAFSNVYAPEHLILSLENAETFIPKIVNPGSVFIGNWSCESLGDYASGTNHTLPTNGFAKNYSGISLDSFLKKITFQRVSPEGLQRIGPAVEKMAAAEALIAHKNAVSIRLKTLKNKP